MTTQPFALTTAPALTNVDGVDAHKDLIRAAKAILAPAPWEDAAELRRNLSDAVQQSERRLNGDQ